MLRDIAVCISRVDCPQTQHWRGFSVIGRTQLVDRFHQRRNVVGWGELDDAMAEIEDMARACAIGGEGGGDACAERALSREQRRRIQIALEGYALSDSGACDAKIDRPVDPDCVAAAGS